MIFFLFSFPGTSTLDLEHCYNPNMLLCWFVNQQKEDKNIMLLMWADFFCRNTGIRKKRLLPSPPPLSFSSSSMLFLMLSYSSSMFWLPRIWLSTRRAFWVSPRWINQRGLSGRKRNPMNWSTAGSTDRPNMYLREERRNTWSETNYDHRNAVFSFVCLLAFD